MNYYPNPNGMMGGVGYPTPSYSVPYGYGGFNGNYFSGGSYNAFNPYALQQQQEEYRKAMEAEQKKQQDLRAKLYGIVCSGSGVEPQQAVIDHIYGRGINAQQPQHIEGLNSMEQFEYSQIIQREQLRYNEQTMIDQMFRPDQSYNPNLMEYNRQMQLWNKYNEERSKKIPDDVGMFEYFKYYAADDYLEAKHAERKRKEQQVQQLYDNNRYNNFLSQFSMNGNIDDMTIRMPSIANEQERAARRKAFIEKIMSN